MHGQSRARSRPAITRFLRSQRPLATVHAEGLRRGRVAQQPLSRASRPLLRRPAKTPPIFDLPFDLLADLAITGYRRPSPCLRTSSIDSQALPQWPNVATYLSRPGLCSPRSPAAARSLPGLWPQPLQTVVQHQYCHAVNVHSVTAGGMWRGGREKRV
jgi:hypothetical protein